MSQSPVSGPKSPVTSLVIGGAGFIGSNLVDALLERGEQVVVLDDLSTGRRSNLEGAIERGAKLIEADIREYDSVLEAFESHRPAAVFHLAAQIDVRRSVDDPGFDASINVTGTANLLEANRVTGNGRFVFSSTGGAIYGEGKGQALPFSEDAPTRPMSPYGQSKLAAEGYLSLYNRLHGSETIAVRLGNVYGPRQDPLGEAGVIAIFCGKLAEGGRPTVFGSGHQTRDYIHVDDVVAAMLAASDSDSVADGPLNVGTGVETSVLDLISRFAALGRGGPGGSGPEGSGPGGSCFEPEFAPARPGEVERISIDPSRAASALGWSPDIGLDAGLSQTLDSLH